MIVNTMDVLLVKTGELRQNNQSQPQNAKNLLTICYYII